MLNSLKHLKRINNFGYIYLEILQTLRRGSENYNADGQLFTNYKYEILTEDYFNKVKPYEEILSKELRVILKFQFK